MSYNTKLMYIQMPPSRRPPMPPTAPNPIRTLGTSRGAGMSKSGNLASSRSEDKMKENGRRPSLSLNDITKFDLMSPYAVQQLTGSFKSSFPTVAGKEGSNLKMVKVQLPTSPYTTLPRLALTKGEDIREEARTNLTRGLSRSHSELSHYRTRDSHRALVAERPHTESRLTRRAQHAGPAVFSSRASTISEESRLPLESETSSSSGSSETSRRESERKHFRFDEPAQQSDRSNTMKDFARIHQRAKLRSHAKSSAWGKYRKGSAKHEPANRAEKMANLGMSEYTEVHATNKQMKGQVWSGVKPKSSPDGTRLVRFNTRNDVFEYTPGHSLKGTPSPRASHAE